MPEEKKVRDVLSVFAIEENGGKTFWHEVGVAFVNKDASLNVKLYFAPGLQLQIRGKK
jgi:hypothetical protein